MRQQFLPAGKIVSVRGLAGDVNVYPLGDGPEQILAYSVLYLDEQGTRPIRVAGARVQKNVVVLHLEGVDSVEAAMKLRDRVLYFNRDDVTLPEDVYYVADLIGLAVSDADTGEAYGQITDVLHTGANDVYVIERDGRRFLFPAVRHMIERTDVEAGIMTVRPIKGIFDE